MSTKKSALFIVLAVISIFSGAVFGLLDIFGFIDGRHALSFTLLLSAAVLTYVALVTAFLLNFAQRNRVYTFFIIASVLFGLTFFIMNLNFILTIIATLIYLAFLVYVYSASVRRSHLFTSFSPRELFFPILRSSFTYFLIIMAILSYTQSQRLISENSLVSPNLVRIVSRPTILMVNQQINAQLQSGLTSDIIDALPLAQKRQAVQLALKKTVEGMVNPSTGEIFGFTPDEIPVTQATISDSGIVDIAPVIYAILPGIAFQLNERIQAFAIFAPFVVALLTFLLLQPLLIPLQLIESLLTVIVFKILMATGFIRLQKEQREVEVPVL